MRPASPPVLKRISPKVTSETEDEVVIDFTDTEKPETTPPPAPEGKTEREDPGEDHPVNPDPEVPKVTHSPCGKGAGQ